MKIFDGIDPRIKKILEKVVNVKFESSMNLSQRKKPVQKENTIQLEENLDSR